MKKTIILILSCLFCMGQVMADNVLTVSNVNVPQGGQATIEVGCEFDTEYTAFELQIVLPDGLSLLADEDGYPVIEKAFDTNHILTGNLLPSNGNYKITCRSMENLSIPTSGILFRVTLVANPSIAIGTSLNAMITACEFTRTADSKGENLGDVNVGIHVTEFRTVLDETSSELPNTETNANVRVKRTINANEWSTICLPFNMTEAQVKAAFGSDVQIGDFKSWNSEEDDGGAIVAIKVGFTAVTAIEANHPYIIKVSAPVTEFTVDGVDIDAEDEPVIQVGKRASERGWFYGTYTKKNVPEENVFLSGNCFWYSTGNTQTKGFRGYFEFRDVLDTYYDTTAARITLSFDEDTTTDISERHNSESIMQNEVYDLQGRKVKAAGGSIYLKNGKKVVVK